MRGVTPRYDRIMSSYERIADGQFAKPRRMKIPNLWYQVSSLLWRGPSGILGFDSGKFFAKQVLDVVNFIAEQIQLTG